MAWWQQLRQSGGSAKRTAGLKWLSQLNNQPRAAVLRHQASPAAFILKGFNANVQDNFNATCGSHLISFSGCSITYRMLLNSVPGNNLTLARRQYTSSSIDDDDFEARLMGGADDDASHREGMFTSGTEHVYGYEGYGENNGEQQFDQWVGEDLGWRDKSSKDGGTTEGGMKLNYASDSDSDMNVASDEEFEAEQTDEEVEELLANTPLFEPPEFEEEYGIAHSFRPDGQIYFPGMEYDPEELDMSKPLEPRRRERREKLAFSVEEIIDKADFRNVRFLTRFIGETGNILARKEFKMRAKSHGRVTKAIKTARFFGLMPYTNMGRPRYVFNEPYDSDADFYESDDTSEEEGSMSKNMTEESEKGRFSGLGAFDNSYLNRNAGGSYDGRRDQDAQRWSG